jgi:uncharacterized protein YciI
MKHFIIEITYTKPMNIIDEILPLHRAYLQTGYDKNMLLCSGPETPRTGGILIARAESISEIEEFTASDPYKLNDAGSYRIIEFNPVKKQDFLTDWTEGK